MHFWIDKRSQACSFSRRPPAPLFIGRGRQQGYFFPNFYPKPMVTPIHRFQSLPVNAGIRHARPPCNRIYSFGRIINNQPQYSNGSTSNNSTPPNLVSPPENRADMITAGPNINEQSNCVYQPPIRRCTAAVVLTILTFYFAYILFQHKTYIGTEYVTITILALIIALGIISMIKFPSCASSDTPEATLEPNETHLDNPANVVTTALSSPTPSEMPPPPYHIAVMLPAQRNLDCIQIIRDSPPPTYEKAVT